MKYKFGIFRHYFQRLLKGGRLRNFISNVICVFLPKHGFTLDGKEIEKLNVIKDVGFLPLPGFIDEGKVNKIMGALNDAKVYDRYDKKKRLFDPKEPPEYARTGSYLNEDIFRCPDIIELANNEQIIRLVSSYLGCKPTLSNVTMWHSYPNKDGGARNSEKYHRDVDDFKFIKVFIYLTDVELEDGPHVYIVGSHNDEKFLDVKRFDDDEIENHYCKERVKYITGKKGDGFIECTYGIHKGLVPQRSGRVVLQFEYSLLPIGAYDYDEKYDGSTNLDCDRYVNRLYI